MNSIEVYVDGFGRVSEAVHDAIDGCSDELLAFRPGPGANSIGWLAWHLTRVQDNHIAGVADRDQLWTSDDWFGRFGLPIDKLATGYGFSAVDVGKVRGVPADDLLGYFDAVHEATNSFLDSVDTSDLDRVVDANWDPPVTLGARLMSVIADDLQHAGQAAFIKGLFAG